MLVTTTRPAVPRRTPLSLREGATTLALAFLAPLAVQGVLLAALWNLAQFGSAPERDIEGVTFEAGSTLTVGAAILIILAIRYAVLAGYWLLVTEKFGLPRRKAFLAALPVAGLWWSLVISSNIARQRYQPTPLTPQFTVATVGFALLSLFLLPMSMEVASATEEGEVRRLAAPCIDQFPQTTAEDPVVSVGQIGLARDEFAARVDEVVASQLGAVARASEEWPTQVADIEVQMLLWQQAAAKNRLTASVGDMETQVQTWEEEFGGPVALRNLVAENGLAPSQLDRYACTVQLRFALSREYPFVETEDGSTEFDDELRLVAKQQRVTVDPSVGFWDVETLSVIPEERQETGPAQQDTEAEQGAAQPVERTFSTKIEYEIDSIPNQEFEGSLNWQADICAGASELLQDRFLNRVQLFERREGRWARVPDANVTAQRGGRCSGGQVNLLVDGLAPEPPANWTDKGWRTCREYQVRIPETPTFQPATVDMCVSARADSVDEGV